MLDQDQVRMACFRYPIWVGETDFGEENFRVTAGQRSRTKGFERDLVLLWKGKLVWKPINIPYEA